MSTKIYDGFRFKAKNLDEVLSLLKQFTQDVNGKAQQIAKNNILNTALSMLDEAFLGINHMITDEKEKNKPFLLLSKARIRDDLKESEKNKEICFHDLGLEISVLMYKKNYLGIPHSSSHEIKNLISEQNWYEEYGYWNNTDRPDHITSAQWSRRKKVWNEALGNDYDLSIAGYTKSVLKCNEVFYYMLKVEANDLVHWLSTEDRFNDRSFNKRVNQKAITFVSRHIKETKFKDEKINEDNSYEIYQLARDSKNPDNEFHSIYLEKKAIIEQILPQTITLDLLSKNFNEIQEIAKEKLVLLEQIQQTNKNTKKAKL
jgi:hypothetical protein